MQAAIVSDVKVRLGNCSRQYEAVGSYMSGLETFNERSYGLIEEFFITCNEFAQVYELVPDVILQAASFLTVAQKAVDSGSNKFGPSEIYAKFDDISREYFSKFRNLLAVKKELLRLEVLEEAARVKRSMKGSNKRLRR